MVPRSPPNNPKPDLSPPSLIHFSDLHLWKYGLDGDLFFKRFLGLANLRLRRARRFPVEVAREVAERIAGEEADFVCFSGDLTTTALRAEFEAGRELFAPLIGRWGERFVSIPGNHDRYTPRAVRGRLYETLFDDRFEAYPFSVDLGSRWTLVGLDCALPRWLTARGHVGGDSLDRLRELLDHLWGRDRRVVVMGHYPLLYPPWIKTHWSHELTERLQLLDVLVGGGASVYLHGHKHVRWRLKYKDLSLINAGSAGMVGTGPDRLPGYVRLTLGDDGPEQVVSRFLARPGEGSPQQWVTGELTEQRVGLH